MRDTDNVESHRMDVETCRYFRINAIEEFAELGRTVPTVHLADDFPSSHIQRSKQGRRSVALIVVRASFSLTRSHRQNGLCAIQRLDLTLLIGAQHQRAFRRIEIQANNIA